VGSSHRPPFGHSRGLKEAKDVHWIKPSLLIEGAYSKILSSQGTAAGDNYKAASLESAARSRRGGAGRGFRDGKAGQHAAAHTDPTSPTGAAIGDSKLGLTKKSIDVDNIVAQSQQKDSDAAYLRSASKYTLLGRARRGLG
jgi:hypothetical protein